jgi:hypothetical protein
MNKYNLGVPLSQDQQDAVWEARSDEGRLGRRVEEYWSIRDRGLSQDTARELIRQAYNLAEGGAQFVHFREGSFITDVEDIACEMIRVLNMDFVHDFASGIYVFDNFAHHEITMSGIFEAVANDPYGGSFEENAEDYITNGYGCFRSGVRPSIYIGENVSIPTYLSQFKQKFQRM